MVAAVAQLADAISNEVRAKLRCRLIRKPSLRIRDACVPIMAAKSPYPGSIPGRRRRRVTE